MRRRQTPPAILIVALAVVLLGSVGLGWTAARRLSAGGSARAVISPVPADPPYDAGDPSPVPADGPRAVPAAPAPSAGGADAPTPPLTPVPGSAAEAARAHAAIAAPATSTPEQTPSDPIVTTGPVTPPATTTAPPQPTPPEPITPTVPVPSITPYEPPPTVMVDEADMPAAGRAWSLLSSLRRRSAAGSQARDDLNWVLDFARAAATPGAPEGRRATARRALRFNAWWYASHGAPTSRMIGRDPDGILLTYRRGHGFMVNPVATMGRWRDLNDAWSPQALAESLLGMVVSRGYDGREWGALEYFDVPGEDRAVRPGVSGMAQARAAQLFAAAWAETHDPRFAAAAARVLGAFTVPVDAGGVLASVRDPAGGPASPWYPERAYPGENGWTGAALNGFMVSLLALRSSAADLAAPPSSPAESAATDTTGAPAPQPAAPDPAASGEATAAAALARSLADRGVDSLVRFLPLHDSGSWSYYGLLTPGRPWRSYLADLNYHCYHVALLRSLDPLYPARGLGRVADRWQGYVSARDATCPER